jgi:hypothetical protein
MRLHPSRRAASKRPNAAPSQIELIYELLDAHDDTARLAAEMGEPEAAWRAHLEYLRALQRKGRETVAQLALEVNQ